LAKKTKGKGNSKSSAVNSPTFRPGAFVFCERDSGTVRFQVRASRTGGLAIEEAASMLAMHCLVRGQTPTDYTILVQPRAGVLDPVERRAGELLKAGQEIRRDFELTGREREVLECVVKSLSNKEIAARLNLAERTVKFHVSALLAKFKVPDRFSLMRRAMIGLQPASDTLAGPPSFAVVPPAEIEGALRTGPAITPHGRELPPNTPRRIPAGNANGNSNMSRTQRVKALFEAS
jgi:DNA-binding CsgD family transcriptional regulator